MTPRETKTKIKIKIKTEQAEELASLKLEAGATKAGAEGLDALAADHAAEAATGKTEVALIHSILKAQVRTRM